MIADRAPVAREVVVWIMNTAVASPPASSVSLDDGESVTVPGAVQYTPGKSVRPDISAPARKLPQGMPAAAPYDIGRSALHWLAAVDDNSAVPASRR